MSIFRKLAELSHVAGGLLRQPRLTLSLLEAVRYSRRGFEYCRDWQGASGGASGETSGVADRDGDNPLRAFCEARVEGPGVWKWDHYLDIYHRHFQRFVGREVHVMEVGVYSGGSLDMWREYFGPKCKIYGVDIEDACRCYENDYTKIFIGDQEDPGFWKDVRQQVPRLDILIDDGGHEYLQQIVSMEEMLPHLQADGVYVCEDIRGELERFNAFAYGLISSLNSMARYYPDGLHATPFQSNIGSLHCYPFVTVVEKTPAPVPRFVAPKCGSEWQPFLENKK